MFFIIPFIYYSDSYSNLNSQLISIAADGTTSTIGNLNFNQNNIYREFTDNLDTTAFNGMMNMAGIGEVRDLQEAATQNQNLANLL
ncbi:hypothetical protein ACC93_00180, partial [Francisella tularensis subsp. holarctica]